MVIGLLDPQGGKVKRSDYALQDNDYVIQQGDNVNTVASAMKVNPKTISDLGQLNPGDVIPGMPAEMQEVSMEEAKRVDPSSVTQDPELRRRLEKFGVTDPSMLSSEDYITAQMLMFNDMLIDEKEAMGEGFNEEDAVKGLAERHPKQMTALFKEFNRVKEAESKARDFEAAKGQSAMGAMFDTAESIAAQQPPVGGARMQMLENNREGHQYGGQ
mgnify:CR=1 FL=1